MHLRSRLRRLSLTLAVFVVAVTSCTSTDPPTPVSSSSSTGISPTVAPGQVLVGRPISPDVQGYFQKAADGSGEEAFAPGKEFEARQLSPDGSLVSIVAVDRAGVLVGGTVNVDGTAFELFHHQDRSLHLACSVWAPRGRMACEGWDDDDPSRAGIYTVRAADGSDPRRLSRSRDVPCDYSPDGTQLAFVRTDGDDGVGTLMVMDADGASARRLSENVVLAGTSCDWSPDGKAILAASADGSLVMVTPSGERSAFAPDGMDGPASGGVWSPNGEWIMFSMIPEGDDLSAAYIASRDGSDLVRLTDPGDYEEAAVWLS